MITPEKVLEGARPAPDRMDELINVLDAMLQARAEQLARYGEIVVPIDSVHGRVTTIEKRLLRQAYEQHWTITERTELGDGPIPPALVWVFRPGRI